MKKRRRVRDTRFSSRRQPKEYGGAAHRKGSENFAAKLTEKKVSWARREHRRGVAILKLARKLRVHPSTMSRALNGVTFQHVR